MKMPTAGLRIVLDSIAAKAEKTETNSVRSTSLGSAETQAGLPAGGWSVANAIDIASTLWGDEATTIVAWAALAAHCEGDRPEFRLWFEVFVRLRAGTCVSGPEDATPRALRLDEGQLSARYASLITNRRPRIADATKLDR